jgi:hypothetical protein
MRKTRRSLVLGTTALSAVLGAGLMTPTAFAGPENYVEFSNSGGFLMTACFKWQGSTAEDYCHNRIPIGQNKRAYFPADAQGVEIQLDVIGDVSHKELSPQITDLNSNHCYEVSGTTFDPRITEKDCWTGQPK